MTLRTFRFDVPAEHWSQGPFRDSVYQYLGAGWPSVLPLPLGKKMSPPRGYTGAGAVTPTRRDYHRWAAVGVKRNVCLRLPEDVIGIDVDAYGDKPGAATLASLEAKLGPLPPTWIATSRDNVSGIRLFRVPAGLKWPGGAGPGIDIVKGTHRYVVVAPSVHPEGREYRWVGPTGAESDEPRLSDLPCLNDDWVQHLTGGEVAEAQAERDLSVDVQSWLDERGGGEPCTLVAGVLAKALAELTNPPGAHHDVALARTMALVGLAAQGHPGVARALEQVRARFFETTKRDSPATLRREWSDLVAGAVQKVAADGKSVSAEDPCKTGETPVPSGRSYTLQRASGVQMAAARWLWHHRIPFGSLSLIAGREGVGKSTFAYQHIADVTQGLLEGECFGVPRNVLIVATEDAWPFTIAPRLVAAGADLDRVFRMNVVDAAGTETALSLEYDIGSLSAAIQESDAAVVLLDPLMSRLGSKIDTHKDADVRRDLEPLVRVAEETGCAVEGIIHFNKGSSTDPLNMIMGSRAFTAVPRAVLFVMADPDDPSLRVLGQAKSNLGPMDTPLMTFAIDSAVVGYDGDREISAGRLRWVGERAGTIQETVARSAQSADSRSAVEEAAGWLQDYLETRGGSAMSMDCKDEGKKLGHTADALKKAAKRIGCVQGNVPGVFPRKTQWSLAGVKITPQSEQTAT